MRKLLSEGGNVLMDSEYLWFVLMVRNRWEKSAAQCLARKGFECLLPISKQRHQWSDRWKEVDVVLFPGYLFCRLDPEQRLPVLSAPGVLSIVGTRSGFTPVGRDEIAAVELVGRAGVPAQPWPFVETGQVVYLDQGPLRGLSGIVLTRTHESKLIISVQLLKRSIAVEIDRTWISSLPVQSRQGVVGTLNVSLLGFEQEELSAQR
jgi:transcription antitermination factor NusG